MPQVGVYDSDEVNAVACRIVAQGRLRLQDDGRFYISEPAEHYSDRLYRVHVSICDHPDLEGTGEVYAIFHQRAGFSWRVYRATLEEVKGVLDDWGCFNWA
jgi:hypothetical protein